MSERNQTILITAVTVVLLLIPVFMGLGKFQLCKYYFQEMNRMACFLTQLPAVMRK